MIHLVIPLDEPHRRALDLVRSHALGPDPPAPGTGASPPHVTVLSFEGLSASAAARAVSRVAAGAAPFRVHAHGFGLFTGPRARDLTLHVPVVRDARLDSLHRRAYRAVLRAGGEVASWTAPPRWSPHVTVLERLDGPEALGRAVAALAGRPHPSWELEVDRVAVWPGDGPGAGPVELRLGAGAA